MKSTRTRLRMGFTLTALALGHPHLAGWRWGALLLLAGTALHAVSAGHLVKRSTLTATGPYRFVRNPFYVADVLRDAGLLLACTSCLEGPSRLLWPLAIAYFAVQYLWIVRRRVLRREEPLLLEELGEPYAAYCRAVPRFVPRLWPAPAVGEGGFRWSNLRHNEELQRTVAMLTLVPLTWLRRRAVEHVPDWGRIVGDAWGAALLALLPLVLLAPKIVMPRARHTGRLERQRDFARRHWPWLAAIPLVVAIAACLRWKEAGVLEVVLLGLAPLTLVMLLRRLSRRASLILRDGFGAGFVALGTGVVTALIGAKLLWLLPATVLWLGLIHTVASRRT